MAIESVKRRGKAKDAIIEAKDQRWHCRNRLTLVFGSNDVEDLDTYIYTDKGVEFKTVNFHQAKSKAIEEILDNSIDEYYRGHVTEIHCTLSKDKTRIVVEDNGIGFPLDKVQQVYSEFRTGSKFKDEEVDEKGFLHRTLGQNGLGAAATCLTSDEFIVRVRHYNSKKEQTYTFIDGALKVKKTKPVKYKGHSGVRVELVLSKEVYKNNVIDEDLLRKRIIDLAYNNPGLIFTFNKEKYCFKKGLLDLARRLDPKNAELLLEEQYKFETKSPRGKKVKGMIDFHVSLCLDKTNDERENFITFVNSSPTFDGGFHKDRIRRLFINTVKEKLERAAKKEKITLVDNDIMTGMTFVIGITMPNPRFESQTKRKLVRDMNLEKGLEKVMNKAMTKYIRTHGDFLDLVIDRAKSRHKWQDLKDASKRGKKQHKQRVEKLLDANERKDRSKCTLFICEGDSAIGGLRSARDKLHQGGIALKGKPMNVAQASIKDVLDNQEFSDIMASIGLTVGHPVDWDRLRYSKIVFLADSDVDGGHINTLLTNFFFTFWPELFHKGVVQLTKAPLFEVVTDQETVYLETPGQLEDLKKKKAVKIKEIHRNKGLGEMSPDAWKWVMNRDHYTEIVVEDAKEAKKMLQVCFGKDTGPRKDLLMEDGSGMVTGRRVATKRASTSSTKQSDAKKTRAKKATRKTGVRQAKKTTKKTNKVAKKKARKSK